MDAAPQLPGWTPPDRGALFVVSGPSGVGKSTLIASALTRIPHLGFSVSATTRAPRAGEVDGVHYHFVTPARFAALVDEGAFLEHATVYDRRYGTLREPVDAALAGGRSVVLDVDARGSAQVREQRPDAVHIVLLPPSVDVLAARLRARGTDAEAVVARRLELAEEQIRAAHTYDYVVINDVLSTAQAAFDAVLLAELSRKERRADAIARMAGSLDTLRTR